MSIFSAIGKGLKKGLGFVGDVAKTAAPVVGLIPGVGTVVGGAIGGVGSLASDVGHGRKVSLANALKSGATGALSGLAGTKLLGGKGLAGALGKIKGGGAATSAMDAAGEGAVTGSGLGSLFKNASIGDLGRLGLAGAGLYSSAKQSGKANDIAERLLAQEEAQDAARGPLRNLFMDRIQNLPSRGPNLDSLFASQNPFKRKAA